MFLNVQVQKENEVDMGRIQTALSFLLYGKLGWWMLHGSVLMLLEA